MIDIEKYITETEEAEKKSIVLLLEKLRSNSTLNEYVLLDHEGFSIPVEKGKLFEDFLSIITKNHDTIKLYELCEDGAGCNKENYFWRLFKDYIENIVDKKKSLKVLLSEDEETQKRIISHAYYEHVLYHAPISEIEAGFSYEQVSVAMNTLTQCFELIFISFRKREDFITTIETQYGLNRELIHFIWDLFQENKDDMKYQAIIKICSLNKK